MSPAPGPGMPGWLCDPEPARPSLSPRSSHPALSEKKSKVGEDGGEAPGRTYLGRRSSSPQRARRGPSRLAGRGPSHSSPLPAVQAEGRT